MSKEFQRSYQSKKETKGSEESLHESSKIQPKIQSKVVSKIQPKLMMGDGKEKNTSSKTSSSILPDELKEKMEGSFEEDFSNVTIHKDSSSAQDINAKAYTQGSDVHFAPGEYNPTSKDGQELIGHELAHVVQQKQGVVGAGEIHGKGLEINQNAGLEKEADDAGRLASEGKKVVVSGHGEGLQKKEGDDTVTYEEYPVVEGDTIAKIVLRKFPYMKFDEELLTNKVNQIARENGVDKDKIFAGKTVLKISFSQEERNNINAQQPTALAAADGEEKAVKTWSETSGQPVEIIRGDKIKESEYKNKEHVGNQYFIGHSSKKEGLLMNEVYSHNSKGDDGYLSKDEIAKGDYSKVPNVFVNACESDENLDGFLQGGAGRAFGYFYKIEDALAAKLGPSILDKTTKNSVEETHRLVREEMLRMKETGLIPIKYWAGVVDKYKEYCAQSYGVADEYELNGNDQNWSKENAKAIRKESRKNDYLKADRKELATLNKETRKIERQIANGESGGNLEAKLQDLEQDKKGMQKQMLLQSQLKGEKGEKKTASVSGILKEGEAVVEIKDVDGVGECNYIAMITIKGSTTPKIIFLPNKGKGVEKRLNAQRNLVNFNDKLGEEHQKNYDIVWKKIQDFLDSNGIKKIYFKAFGGYNKANINTFNNNGKYLLEFLDVQYLY